MRSFPGRRFFKTVNLFQRAHGMEGVQEHVPKHSRLLPAILSAVAVFSHGGWWLRGHLPDRSLGRKLLWGQNRSHAAIQTQHVRHDVPTFPNDEIEFVVG